VTCAEWVADAGLGRLCERDAMLVAPQGGDAREGGEKPPTPTQEPGRAADGNQTGTRREPGGLRAGYGRATGSDRRHRAATDGRPKGEAAASGITAGPWANGERSAAGLPPYSRGVILQKLRGNTPGECVSPGHKLNRRKGIRWISPMQGLGRYHARRVIIKTVEIQVRH